MAGFLREGPMKTFCNIQVATAVILVLAINAQAQVITDGTLGAIKTLQGPSYSIPGTIGQIAGTNLFHSFSQFNINTGESATFRIEFLPPNGLGTVSLASGSGIHWPSTTRQYS